ncbi:hypothetical protein BD626DRAFT_478444 [Schizophyllum amplum]|uniref:Secreted protein n=1 Tax=Schizophyllum amplum TaxID=97359 RepID=A0A550CRC0_9AGAR|nr:hypothetical protein BD626DRAFT_478444 [Auriculariopsis ampla]
MGGVFILLSSLPAAARLLGSDECGTARVCGYREFQGIARACVMRGRVPLTPVVRPCCTHLVPSALDTAKARAHSGGGGQSCCVGGGGGLGILATQGLGGAVSSCR